MKLVGRGPQVVANPPGWWLAVQPATRASFGQPHSWTPNHVHFDHILLNYTDRTIESFRMSQSWPSVLDHSWCTDFSVTFTLAWFEMMFTQRFERLLLLDPTQEPSPQGPMLQGPAAFRRTSPRGSPFPAGSSSSGNPAEFRSSIYVTYEYGKPPKR